VEGALAAGQNLAERKLLLKGIRADNQRALELSQTNYRIGTTDLRAVQQQQISVYGARLTLLRVESEELAQRVNLHLALGGSFKIPVSSQDEGIALQQGTGTPAPASGQAQETVLSYAEP